MAGVQLLTLELVQQYVLGVRAEDAVLLYRLSMLRRSQRNLMLRYRALALRLQAERVRAAELEEQRDLVQGALEDAQEEREDLGESAATLQQDYDLLRRELGFNADWHEPERYVAFIQELRRRTAVVDAAPRDVGVLLRQRAELLTALGLHADYDDHALAVERAVAIGLQPRVLFGDFVGLRRLPAEVAAAPPTTPEEVLEA